VLLWGIDDARLFVHFVEHIASINGAGAAAHTQGGSRVARHGGDAPRHLLQHAMGESCAGEKSWGELLLLSRLEVEMELGRGTMEAAGSHGEYLCQWEEGRRLPNLLRIGEDCRGKTLLLLLLYGLSREEEERRGAVSTCCCNREEGERGRAPPLEREGARPPLLCLGMKKGEEGRAPWTGEKLPAP
jgi:hypothetical protein